MNITPEKLDELITAGMLAAKRKCRIFYRLPWDKEMHEVMMSKNIIKTLFMGMRQKIEMSVVLDLKMKKLKEPFNLPTTYDNCNALLKTLEEPPDHVKFLLATTDPKKVPVTVLSRCLQFQLRNIPSKGISI